MSDEEILKRLRDDCLDFRCGLPEYDVTCLFCQAADHIEHQQNQLKAFEDEECIRADALPWEEMEIACYEEFAEPEDRADYAVLVLERVLALRDQEEGNE